MSGNLAPKWTKSSIWTRLVRGLVALLSVAAGALHFSRPEACLKIVPPYLPVPLALVYLSGAFEILGGVGRLIPPLRRWTGIGLIALPIAVFPANIEMLIQNLRRDGLTPFVWVLIARLPPQLFLSSWSTG